MRVVSSSLPDVFFDRLGHAPDAAIAEEFGVKDDVVRYWRIKAGIPSWRGERRMMADLPPAVVNGNPNVWLLGCGRILSTMLVTNSTVTLPFPLLFRNAELAENFLDSVRWPLGATCPSCSHRDAVRLIQRKRRFYRCCACNRHFTVRNGTILEGSQIPLSTWLYILYLLETNERAKAAEWTGKQVGLTKKTIWFVYKRIQAAREGLSAWSMTSERINEESRQERVKAMKPKDEGWLKIDLRLVWTADGFGKQTAHDHEGVYVGQVERDFDGWYWTRSGKSPMGPLLSSKSAKATLEAALKLEAKRASVRAKRARKDPPVTDQPPGEVKEIRPAEGSLEDDKS